MRGASHPNGDVLVAETNGPPRPENAKGFAGGMMKREMKRAGSGAGMKIRTGPGRRLPSQMKKTAAPTARPMTKRPSRK